MTSQDATTTPSREHLHCHVLGRPLLVHSVDVLGPPSAAPPLEPEPQPEGRGSGSPPPEPQPGAASRIAAASVHDSTASQPPAKHGVMAARTSSRNSLQWMSPSVQRSFVKLPPGHDDSFAAQARM
jgi:hypothetical protein